MKTPSAALSIVTSHPRLMRLLLVVVVPIAIVAATLAPRAGALVHIRLPAVQWHAPRLQIFAHVPHAVQLHVAAVLIALAIGVILLIGVKGNTMHRTLGWIWVVAMMTGAVSSLFIRVLNPGALSFIHLFSGWTIIALPMGVAFARRHKARLHARTMTRLFTGGLVVAGLFSFVPGRLMWDVFF